MIAAVLFDYGGVLSAGGSRGSHASMLTARLGVAVSSDSVQDLHSAFRVGAMSPSSFVRAVHARFPERKHDLDERSWEWPELLDRRDRLYDLARRMRERGISTGIASNVWPPFARMLARAGAYDGFDPLVLSCDVGCAKPDAAFYDAALRRLGAAAADALFVDDQAGHLAAAAITGMQTLLAVDEPQILRDVAARVGLSA